MLTKIFITALFTNALFVVPLPSFRYSAEVYAFFNHKPLNCIYCFTFWVCVFAWVFIPFISLALRGGVTTFPLGSCFACAFLATLINRVFNALPIQL